jgi:hypothetical protein
MPTLSAIAGLPYSPMQRVTAIKLGTGMKQLEHLILLTPTLSIRRGSKLLKLFRTHSLTKQ